MTSEEYFESTKAINDPRRIELIIKQHKGGGLTTEEAEELKALQDASRIERNKIAPLDYSKINALLEKIEKLSQDCK